MTEILLSKYEQLLTENIELYKKLNKANEALDSARIKNDSQDMELKLLKKTCDYWKKKYDEMLEEKKALDEDVNYFSIRYSEAHNESNKLFEYLLKICCGEDVSSDNMDFFEVHEMRKKLMEANFYDLSEKGKRVSCCDILRDVFRDVDRKPFVRDVGGDTDGDRCIDYSVYYSKSSEWKKRASEDEFH